MNTRSWDPGQWRLDRRTFLRQSTCTLAVLSLPVPLFPFFPQQMRQGYVKPYPALFYQVRVNQKVKCLLCPRNCEVKPGERGDCGVRENRKGVYYSLVYGNPCAVHVDPIEKKPFFHVLPGTPSFSIATAGCNLHCIFCQNWEISQAKPEETYNQDLPPEEVVAGARKADCPTIAYTYVEPVVFYEYMLDTARLAKKAGILNVCHSAGYVSPEPLAQLAEVLDAACIDLKAFDDSFYQELVDGELEPVLNTLKTLRRLGVHVEVVKAPHPIAFLPLLPAVPDEKPLPHAGEHPGAGPGNRPEGRSEICVPGQPAGPPGGEHSLPPLRQADHRPPGLHGGGSESERWQVPLLWHQNPGHLAYLSFPFSVFRG